MRGVLYVLIGTVMIASAVAAAEKPRVRLETSKGVIVLELDPGAAPITVENFLTYVRDGYYDGIIFHRVIAGFMAQAGGVTADFTPRAPRAPIRNEADNGLSNRRGTVAMARRSAVDSATSQFFINLVDNLGLDHRDSTPQGFGYCVFGRVVEGMDVVDAIAAVPTGPAGPFRKDVPRETVTIIRATVVE